MKRKTAESRTPKMDAKPDKFDLTSKKDSYEHKENMKIYPQRQIYMSV